MYLYLVYVLGDQAILIQGKIPEDAMYLQYEKKVSQKEGISIAKTAIQHGSSGVDCKQSCTTPPSVSTSANAPTIIEPAVVTLPTGFTVRTP